MNGVNFALINGIETNDIILPVASLPYYRYNVLSPGSHRIYRFDNGYGLSVIPDDRGLLGRDFEAFIVKFTALGMETNDFSVEALGESGIIPAIYDIDYDNPISNGSAAPFHVNIKDLHGYLTDVRALEV